MFRYLKSKKLLFALAVIIIIGLNFYTLSVAYPTMNHPLNLGGADLPRDFSVYYIAAWRLFHNPSQIFTTGPITDGEPTIYPSLTPYKYLPSFLVLISPLINLSYYPAFWVFDAFQFALLPLMALLMYKLLEKKNPAIALLVLVLVLLLPYPMPGRGLSVSYFMSWAEGQAKIFLSFLLLVSFFLGYKGRAALSGVAFALGAFDPRFALLALPLFFFYNKSKLKIAFVPMLIALIATNFMVFYPGIARGFVGMVLGSGSTTPLYTPGWIPLVMLVSLLLINSKQMIVEVRKVALVERSKIKRSVKSRWALRRAFEIQMHDTHSRSSSSLIVFGARVVIAHPNTKQPSQSLKRSGKIVKYFPLTLRHSNLYVTIANLQIPALVIARILNIIQIITYLVG